MPRLDLKEKIDPRDLLSPKSSRAKRSSKNEHTGPDSLPDEIEVVNPKTRRSRGPQLADGVSRGGSANSAGIGQPLGTSANVASSVDTNQKAGSRAIGLNLNKPQKADDQNLGIQDIQNVQGGTSGGVGTSPQDDVNRQRLNERKQGLLAKSQKLKTQLDSIDPTSTQYFAMFFNNLLFTLFVAPFKTIGSVFTTYIVFDNKQSLLNVLCVFGLVLAIPMFLLAIWEYDFVLLAYPLGVVITFDLLVLQSFSSGEGSIKKIEEIIKVTAEEDEKLNSEILDMVNSDDSEDLGDPNLVSSNTEDLNLDDFSENDLFEDYSTIQSNIDDADDFQL